MCLGPNIERLRTYVSSMSNKHHINYSPPLFGQLLSSMLSPLFPQILLTTSQGDVANAHTVFLVSGEYRPTHAGACQAQRTVLPTSRKLPTKLSGSCFALRRWHRGISCTVLENNSAFLCEQSDGELVSRCSLVPPILGAFSSPNFYLTYVVSSPGGRTSIEDRKAPASRQEGWKPPS